MNCRDMTELQEEEGFNDALLKRHFKLLVTFNHMN